MRNSHRVLLIIFCLSSIGDRATGQQSESQRAQPNLNPTPAVATYDKSNQFVVAGISHMDVNLHAELIRRYGTSNSKHRSEGRRDSDVTHVPLKELMREKSVFSGHHDWASDVNQLSELPLQPMALTAQAPRKPGESRWNVAPKRATLTVTAQSIDDQFATLNVSADTPSKLGRSSTVIVRLKREGEAAVLTEPVDDGYICYWVAVGNEEKDGVHDTAATSVYANPQRGDIVATELPSAILPAVESLPDAATAGKNYDPDRHYEIKSQIIEVSNDVFGRLRSALNFAPQNNGAIVKMSVADANQFSEFLKPLRKNNDARVLSRPVIRMVAGQPATITVGRAMPILAPVDAENLKVEFKTVGMELKVTAREAAPGQHYLEWELMNSSPVSAVGGQGLRSQHGFDGATTIAGDDVLLVATKLLDGDKPKWLLCLMELKFHCPPTKPFVAPAAARSLPSSQDGIQVPKPDVVGSRPMPSQQTLHVASPLQLSSSLPNDRLFVLGDYSTDMRGSQNETWLVKSSLRVRKVTDFDAEVLESTPVQGHPELLSVRMLRPGSCKMKLTFEDNTVKVIKVNVLGSDGGLTAYLQRLYPDRAINVFPIKESVLLRGEIANEDEANQVIGIAEQFFPCILNQLRIREDISQPSTSHIAATAFTRHIQQLRDTGTYHIQTVNKYPLFLVSGDTYRFVCPEPVRSIGEYQKQVIDCGVTVGAKNLTVKANIGTTRLYVVGQSGTSYTVDIVAEDNTSHLTFVAMRLYPKYNLSFIPVKGAVVVRGAVSSAREANEVIQIAEQYYPVVLNHITVVNSTKDVMKHPGPGVAAAVPDTHERLRPNAPVVPAAFPSNRPDAEIDEIRNDIKALHKDVRGLIEILKPRDRDLKPGQNDVTQVIRDGVWLVPFCRIDDEAYVDMVRRCAASVDAVSVSPIFQPNSSFAESQQVENYPTLVLLKDGEVVDRLVGPVTEKQLNTFIHSCENYLSRMSVPFDEDSVVAVRRIDKDGHKVHAVDYDIGVIIASEPGRSIIAVPAGAMPRDDPKDRFVVYVSPGTERQQAIAADVLWDMGAMLLASDAATTREDLDTLDENGFALLEIQHSEQLPVCPLVRSPSFIWDNSDVAASKEGAYPHSFIGHNHPYVVFRPRPLMSNKSHENVAGQEATSQWLSVVCRHQKGEWSDCGTMHRFEADFYGPVIAVNRQGEFVGFGSAVEQDGIASAFSPDGPRSTVSLSQSIDIYLATYFAGREDCPPKDSLVLSAVHPTVIKALDDLEKQQQQSMSITNYVEGSLGLTLGDFSAAKHTWNRKQLLKRYHGGLLIESVEPNSIAAKAGVRGNDVLLGLNGFETLNLANLKYVLNEASQQAHSDLPFCIFRNEQALSGTFKKVTLDSSTIQTISSANDQVTLSKLVVPADTADPRRIPPQRPYRLQAPVNRLVVIRTEYPIKTMKMDERHNKYGAVEKLSDHEVSLCLTADPGISALEVDLELEGCTAPFRIRLEDNDTLIPPELQSTDVVQMIEDAEKEVELADGESTRITTSESVQRVKVGSGDVIGVDSSSDRVLTIKAIQPGTSSLHYWLAEDPIPKLVEVVVSPN